MILLNKAKDQEYKMDLFKEENIRPSDTYNNHFIIQKNVSFQSKSNQTNKSYQSITQENVSIDVIKISNEIMKNIEITEKHAEYFADKFSDNSYKNFLNNLIGYKYNKTTLDNILRDIKIKNMNLQNYLLQPKSNLNKDGDSLKFENNPKHECDNNKSLIKKIHNNNHDAKYEENYFQAKDKAKGFLFYENDPNNSKQTLEYGQNDKYNKINFKKRENNFRNRRTNNYNSDLVHIKMKNKDNIPKDFKLILCAEKNLSLKKILQ